MFCEHQESFSYSVSRCWGGYNHVRQIRWRVSSNKQAYRSDDNGIMEKPRWPTKFSVGYRLQKSQCRIGRIMGIVSATPRHPFIYQLLATYFILLLFSPYANSFFQPSSVHGWTSAFLLTVHRLCGVIEERLSHFLPCWLRMGWRSAVSQGKIPWNAPPWLGIEPGPRGGQTVSYSTELWWLTL